MIRLRLALSLLGLLALPLAAARAGTENTSTTVKFSDPTRPGTLRVFATQGDVKVRGVPTPASPSAPTSPRPPLPSVPTACAWSAPRPAF
jgi:hypothetical protein